MWATAMAARIARWGETGDVGTAVSLARSRWQATQKRKRAGGFPWLRLAFQVHRQVYPKISWPGGTSAREMVVLQANASKTEISWRLEASQRGWSGESGFEAWSWKARARGSRARRSGGEGVCLRMGSAGEAGAWAWWGGEVCGGGGRGRVRETISLVQASWEENSLPSRYMDIVLPSKE